MDRKNRSRIWDIPGSELSRVVKASSTFTSILKTFNLNAKSGHTATLKRRLDSERIDYSHISQGKNSNRGRKFDAEPKNKIPLNQIMVKNSSYQTGKLRRRLLKDKLIENRCEVCGIGPKWNGKELVLQLDHCNGISNDHRKSNIRLVCPNCHSQTETFAGRNVKKNAL